MPTDPTDLQDRLKRVQQDRFDLASRVPSGLQPPSVGQEVSAGGPIEDEGKLLYESYKTAGAEPPVETGEAAGPESDEEVARKLYESYKRRDEEPAKRDEEVARKLYETYKGGEAGPGELQETFEGLPALLGQDFELPTTFASHGGAAGTFGIDEGALRRKVSSAVLKRLRHNAKQQGQGLDTEALEGLKQEAENQARSLVSRWKMTRTGKLPWIDTDPKEFHEGLQEWVRGESPAKDEGLLGKALEATPVVARQQLAPVMAGLMGAQQDVTGRVPGEEAPLTLTYNESGGWGALNWFSRLSLFSYLATTAKAAGVGDARVSNWEKARKLWGPMQADQAWGSPEHLKLIERGEDLITLAPDLSLGRLNPPGYALFWTLDKAGILPKNWDVETSNDYLTGFLLSLLDPDVLSIATAGASKATTLTRGGQRLLGEAGESMFGLEGTALTLMKGDVPGAVMGAEYSISSNVRRAARLAKKKEVYEEAARKGKELAEKEGVVAVDDLVKETEEALKAVSPGGTLTFSSQISAILGATLPLTNRAAAAMSAARRAKQAMGKAYTKMTGDLAREIKAKKELEGVMSGKAAALAEKGGKRAVKKEIATSELLQKFHALRLEHKAADLVRANLRHIEKTMRRLGQTYTRDKGLTEGQASALGEALKKAKDDLVKAHEKAFTTHPGIDDHEKAMEAYFKAEKSFRAVRDVALRKLGGDAAAFLHDAVADSDAAVKSAREALDVAIGKLSKRRIPVKASGLSKAKSHRKSAWNKALKVTKKKLRPTKGVKALRASKHTDEFADRVVLDAVIRASEMMAAGYGSIIKNLDKAVDDVDIKSEVAWRLARDAELEDFFPLSGVHTLLGNNWAYKAMRWVVDSAGHIWNPALRTHGLGSVDMQRVLNASLGESNLLQSDMVMLGRLAKAKAKTMAPKAIADLREAKREIREAVQASGKPWTEADEASIEELDMSIEGAYAHQIGLAKVELITEYISSNTQLGKTVLGAMGNVSTWDAAKPVLRSLIAGRAEPGKMVDALTRMWLPSGQAGISPALEAKIEGKIHNLLLYGQTKVPSGKAAEAKAKRKLGQMTFSDFMDQSLKITATVLSKGDNVTAAKYVALYRRKEGVRAHGFAAQAIGNAAILNRASSRATSLLGGVSPKTGRAVMDISMGDAGRAGENFQEAMVLFDKLQIPPSQRRLVKEGMEDLAAGIRHLEDLDSGFNALIPRTFIAQMSKKMGRIVKTTEAYTPKSADPATSGAQRALSNIVRLYNTSLITGVMLPRAQQFTNIAVGNFAQMWVRQGVYQATRTLTQVTLGSTSEYVAGRLAHHVPGLGAFADRGREAMAKTLGVHIDKTLPSLTTVVVNPHLSLFYDHALCPNDTVLKTMHGEEYTMGQLRNWAREQGVLTSFASSSGLRNLIQRTSHYQGAMKFWRNYWDGRRSPGEVYADIMDAFETRQRVALFSDLLYQGKSPEYAGQMVRQALYDWNSPVTKIEQEYITKMFMFWGFMRRALGQGARSLTDALVSGKDDAWTDVLLKASPGFSKLAGEDAYETANLMKTLQGLRALQENSRSAPPMEDENDPDLRRVYPWWAQKAGNLMWLDNLPVDPQEQEFHWTYGNNYTHVARTMPAFTNLEMAGFWLGQVQLLGAWAAAPSDSGATADYLYEAGLSWADMGGRVTGPVLKTVLDFIIPSAAEPGYRKPGKGVRVRSLYDRQVMELVENVPFMGPDLLVKDFDEPGMMRAPGWGYGLYKSLALPISYEAKNWIEPLINIQHGIVGDEFTAESVNKGVRYALGQWLGIPKRYAHDPQQTLEWDEKYYKDKAARYAKGQRRTDRETGPLGGRLEKKTDPTDFDFLD